MVLNDFEYAFVSSLKNDQIVGVKDETKCDRKMAKSKLKEAKDKMFMTPLYPGLHLLYVQMYKNPNPIKCHLVICSFFNEIVMQKW